MKCHLFSGSDSPIEQLPSGWATAQVTFKRQNALDVRVEVIHLKSQTRYLHEPMKMIALKCMELIIGIPLYFICYMAFHALRLPIVPLAIVCTSLKDIKILKIRGCVRNIFGEIPKNIAKSIWKIVSAPFFAIAMEFSAVYGVFDPIRGRALIGKIERWVHRPKTRRDDVFRYHMDEYNLLNAFTEKDFSHTFYLAHCMQPFGKLTDAHVQQGATVYLTPEIQMNLLPARV